MNVNPPPEDVNGFRAASPSTLIICGRKFKTRAPLITVRELAKSCVLLRLGFGYCYGETYGYVMGRSLTGCPLTLGR